MARLDWVRQRLENWSRWCSQRDSGGLGFPKQSAFVRLGVSSGRSESFVPTDSIEASETDDAVKSLQFSLPGPYQVLVLHYARNMDRALVARKMGCTDRTVRSHLERGDYAIERWLEDKRAAKQRLCRR